MKWKQNRWGPGSAAFERWMGNRWAESAAEGGPSAGLTRADRPGGIVGTDKKPIDFEVLGIGKIEWRTDNISDAHRRIAAALIKTKFGIRVLEDWRDMRTELKLSISDIPAALAPGLGITEPRGSKTIKAGTNFGPGLYVYAKAKTILFENVIRNRIGKKAEQGFDFIDFDEGLGVAAVHERFHLDPRQIQVDDGLFIPRDEEGTDMSTNPNYRHTYPFNAEVSFRKEYRERWGGNDKWLTWFHADKGSTGKSKPRFFGLDEAYNLLKSP